LSDREEDEAEEFERWVRGRGGMKGETRGWRAEVG